MDLDQDGFVTLEEFLSSCQEDKKMSQSFYALDIVNNMWSAARYKLNICRRKFFNLVWVHAYIAKLSLNSTQLNSISTQSKDEVSLISSFPADPATHPPSQNSSF